LEQLEIGAQLGRGASAKVYLATHRPTNKMLALKVLDNDLEANEVNRRLLLNEVKLVYNARSDHLLTFYDAFLHEGHIYLALEYMDMGSVEGLFEVPKHAVHRDLKPANVLLNSAGACKLSDFGVSKQLGATQGLAETQCGTTAYMSPERIKGESYAYPSDVWSFGIVALEGASGVFPYPAFGNYFEVVKRIVDGPLPTEDPAVQALLSAELYDLVHACLNKEPTLRPDVLALMRHPYIQGATREPCDLSAYLLSVLGPPAVPGRS